MGTNVNHAYEDFANKYKVNSEELNKLENYNITYLDKYLKSKGRLTRKERDEVIGKITESIKREEKKKRQQRQDRKRRIRRAQRSKQSTKFKGNIKRRIAVLVLAGIAIVGGVGVKNAYDQYQRQNAPATVEQVLAYGEGLKELGIDNNILSELEKVQMSLQLSENLTNQEIRELAPKISNLQFDVIKTKLSKVLGVPEGDIKVYTNSTKDGRTEEKVKVINGNTYRNKDIFTYENTISSEVSEYIKEVAEMQDIIGDLQYGNFNREDILKVYKEMVDNTNNFAASRIKIDEKGNISVEQTKVKDLEKQANETKTDILNQEKDIGEDR